MTDEELHAAHARRASRTWWTGAVLAAGAVVLWFVSPLQFVSNQVGFHHAVFGFTGLLASGTVLMSAAVLAGKTPPNRT